jgi:hypothetical protein
LLDGGTAPGAHGGRRLIESQDEAAVFPRRSRSVRPT